LIQDIEKFSDAIVKSSDMGVIALKCFLGCFLTIGLDIRAAGAADLIGKLKLGNF